MPGRLSNESTRTSLSLPPVRALLFAAVAAGYGAAAYAIVARPPPLAFTVPLAVLYALLVNLGTYFPNLGVFVDVVARGPRGAKGVALTFDDGPHPKHTRDVLDVLDEYGAKATFFIVGVKAEGELELLAEMARRGHDLAVHGYTHDRFLNMRNEKRIARDVEATLALIERASGQRTRLFRPPLGFTSPRTRVVVKALGLDVIGYSARAYDGLDVTSVERVVRRLEPGIEDGAILLLHDAAERGDRRPASVDALREVLELMKKRGLAGVGLTTWLEQGEPRTAFAEASTS